VITVRCSLGLSQAVAVTSYEQSGWGNTEIGWVWWDRLSYGLQGFYQWSRLRGKWSTLQSEILRPEAFISITMSRGQVDWWWCSELHGSRVNIQVRGQKPAGVGCKIFAKAAEKFLFQHNEVNAPVVGAGYMSSDGCLCVEWQSEQMDIWYDSHVAKIWKILI